MRWRPTDSAGQLAKLDLMARHPGVYPMVMAGGLIVAGLSTVSRAATCQGRKFPIIIIIHSTMCSIMFDECSFVSARFRAEILPLSIYPRLMSFYLTHHTSIHPFA